MTATTSATWYGVTIAQAGRIPVTLAVEARDEAHARRRLAKTVPAGAEITSVAPLTREGWIVVARSFPLPGRATPAKALDTRGKTG